MGEVRIDSYSGGTLVADRSGSGRIPLILIHCWAGNRRFWEEHVALLRDRYDLIVPDLGGHGTSEVRRDDWSMQAFAAEIAAWADELRLAKPVLVGHSMGGGVALEAARRLGDDILGTVLVDTFGMDFGHIERAEVDAQLAAMDADFPATVGGIVNATATDRTDEALKQRLIDAMSRSPREPAVAAWEALLTWDPLPGFRDVSTPVAYIQNGNMHPDARERYTGFLVSDRVMAGHGHFLHMEDPERFCELLDKAVADLG